MNLDYVKQSLGEDEELIHVARFHWMYTVSAMFNILFGIVAAILTLVLAVKFEPMLLNYSYPPEGVSWMERLSILHPAVKIISFFFIVFGVFKFVQMMIYKVTTEIAITNNRLIYKRGLIARYVGEINIDRIEGVNVLQGFWGRIFDFGRVMIRGMGVGEVVLPPIERPIVFRKAIEKARTI